MKGFFFALFDMIACSINSTEPFHRLAITIISPKSASAQPRWCRRRWRGRHISFDWISLAACINVQIDISVDLWHDIRSCTCVQALICSAEAHRFLPVQTIINVHWGYENPTTTRSGIASLILHRGIVASTNVVVKTIVGPHQLMVQRKRNLAGACLPTVPQSASFADEWLIMGCAEVVIIWSKPHV
jgi:hypothetical protein